MKDFVRNMVGYHTNIHEAMKSTKPVNYVVGINGLYEICKNEIGTFIIKAEDIRGGANVQTGFLVFIPEEPYVEYQGQRYLIGKDGLYKVGIGKFGSFARKVEKLRNSPYIKEGFKVNLPKIPYSIYQMIINFFKAVEKKHNAEVMVEIWWDKTKKEYFVYCPEQEISEVSIDYKKNKDLLLNDNYILVMDIHSHNFMPAFFSATDNRDEKDTRFFGVVGSLHRSKPEFSFRMGVRGQFKTVEFNELFEKHSLMTKKGYFPQEWLNQIKVSKFSLSSLPSKYYNYNNNYFFYRQQRNKIAGSMLNNIIERNTYNNRRLIIKQVLDVLSTMTAEEEQFFFSYLIHHKFTTTSRCLQTLGYSLYRNDTKKQPLSYITLDPYGQKVLKEVFLLDRIDYKHLLQDLMDRGYKEKMVSAFINSGYKIDNMEVFH